MIKLENVKKEEEGLLHNLMQFYIYEFSRYKPSITLEPEGTYLPFDLNKYWNDPAFQAFFITYETELAGFALVENEPAVKTIQEFFIMAKYSGRGFGKEAAAMLFNLYPGHWTLSQIEANYPAQAFWRKLIHRLTNGKMVERYDEDRNSIQEFHTDSFVK
ncbi:GNAT family N-acetyltransferase [Halobacillus rhizosphaerae]|uniref:GNAT family N-acetyltransferase n=1 Tax=Halobacillus rhizosphaerae TaxID=3064889 RepID=UPI00398A63B2